MYVNRRTTKNCKRRADLERSGEITTLGEEVRVGGGGGGGGALKLVLLVRNCAFNPEAVPDYKYEPAHDKTYNKICVISKSSDQYVHPFTMARVLVYPSLDSRRAVEGTCVQQDYKSRLIWVFVGRTSLIVGFVVRWLICVRSAYGVPNLICETSYYNHYDCHGTKQLRTQWRWEARAQ